MTDEKLTQPFASLIERSLQQMPPAKRELFAAHVCNALSECVARLSSSAHDCSNGGWGAIKADWPLLRSQYDAEARRRQLQAVAERRTAPSPEAAEEIRPTLWWLAEWGTPGDLPLLRRCQEVLVASADVQELLRQVIALLESRPDDPPLREQVAESDPPAPPTLAQVVNFHLLTRLGDALVWAEADTLVHGGSRFVRIFRHGTNRLEGILEVPGDDRAPVWYDVHDAEQDERKLKFRILDSAGRVRGVLCLSAEGQRPLWEATSSPPAP